MFQYIKVNRFSEDALKMEVLHRVFSENKKASKAKTLW